MYTAHCDRHVNQSTFLEGTTSKRIYRILSKLSFFGVVKAEELQLYRLCDTRVIPERTLTMWYLVFDLICLPAIVNNRDC